MGASGCTWFKHWSEEGGLIPWTLWFILYPGCSPASIHRIKFPACSHCHITPWQPCVVALCRATGSMWGAQSSLILVCTIPQAALPDGRSFTPWKHPTPGYLRRRAMCTATPQDQTSCLPRVLTKVLRHQREEARWRRNYIALLALYSTEITLGIHEYTYFKQDLSLVGQKTFFFRSPTSTMPQAFHLCCCQQLDLSFSLPACCGARQKGKPPGPTRRCPTPEPAHCLLEAACTTRSVLPSPQPHLQRPACLPQPGVHKGSLHKHLFLKRTCQWGTALQRGYPAERSLSSPGACTREPLCWGFLYSHRYRYSHDGVPWNFLKWYRTEHMEASKPQCLNPNSIFPSQCPTAHTLPHTPPKDRVRSFQDFGYFYGYASAVLWGQTMGSVVRLWPMWLTSHTNIYRFLQGIKCELWFWAAHPFSCEALKGEIIPLGVETIS